MPAATTVTRTRSRRLVLMSLRIMPGFVLCLLADAKFHAEQLRCPDRHHCRPYRWAVGEDRHVTVDGVDLDRWRTKTSGSGFV